MTNYLESTDGKLLATGNTFRSKNLAFIVPQIIAERLNQGATKNKLNDILSAPKNMKDDNHWIFQRSLPLIDTFLDICRMIQIGHKEYYTKKDIRDSLLWLIQQKRYVTLLSWFKTGGHSIEETIDIFVDVMIHHIMFSPRTRLDSVSQIYFMDDSFSIKNGNTISLMEMRDVDVNGKPVVEYRLTEAVIQYLQMKGDINRYEKFAIDFKSLQEQLQLDMLNPNDLLFQIRDAIQNLSIVTKRVEKAYQDFVKNISRKTSNNFYELLSDWHNQANAARETGEKNLASLKAKVSAIRLETSEVSSNEARQKLSEWLACKDEERRYINNLSKSLALLTSLEEKVLNPDFSGFKHISLRDIKEVFNTNSVRKINLVFSYLAPLFITKKKKKMFNFEILFTPTTKTVVKQTKENKLSSKQALTTDTKIENEKKQKEKDDNTISLIKEFLSAFDEAIKPISAQNFLIMYESQNANKVGQPLGHVLFKNKRLLNFFNNQPYAFRRILQALTLSNTTLGINDTAINGNIIGFNKPTIMHFLADMDYYYAFLNASLDENEEKMILTTDDRAITNLIVAKVKKEEISNWKTKKK